MVVVEVIVVVVLVVVVIMVLCLFLDYAGIKKNTNRTYLALKRKKDAAKHKAELNTVPTNKVKKKPSR